MSFYRAEIKVISRATGQSSAATHGYDTRSRHLDKSDLQATGSVNMPAWFGDDAGMYWKAADQYERANGSLARRAIISFPVELPAEAREQTIKEWLAKNCPNMPASWVIHDAGDGNPHAHLLISERQADGIDRPPELWFKRYNSKEPSKGGAKKADLGSRRKEWLADARESWAEVLNSRLPADRQVDHRSLRDRGIHDRDPQPKFGAKVLAAEAKGIRTRLVSSVIEDASQQCTVRCLSFIDRDGREVTFRAASDRGDRVDLIGKPSIVKCREIVKMAQEKGWASVEVTGTDEFQKMMKVELRKAGIRIEGESNEQNREHHSGADHRSGEPERGLYGSRSPAKSAPACDQHGQDRRSGGRPSPSHGGAGQDAERAQAAPEAVAVVQPAGTAAADRNRAAGGDPAGFRGDIHTLAGSHGMPTNTKAGGDAMQKDLTSILVSKQLAAMRGIDTFEVGIFDLRIGKMQNIEMGRADVLASVARLKRENAKGNDIYIRPLPREQHPFVFLDDVPIGTINQMQRDGLHHVLEVETSPLNYQVLLRLPENLARSDRKAVERILQERYKSDLNSADGGHYMRLASFTNKKPRHVQDDGRSPYVKLSASKPNAVLSAATWQALKAQAEQRIADEIADDVPLPKPKAKALPLAALAAGVVMSDAQVRASMERQYRVAQAKWGAQFDISRADYFIARNLLQRGASERSVNFAMQDLSPDIATRKSGRVADYVELTVSKAYQSIVELAELGRVAHEAAQGVAESPWNGWPDAHGISGRMIVDWVAE